MEYHASRPNSRRGPDDHLQQDQAIWADKELMSRRLNLIPVGAIQPSLIDSLADPLSKSLEIQCAISDTCIDPTPAYDTSRGQYDSHLLLPPLEQIALSKGVIVLGITEVDIFLSVFTFVFGVAKFKGVAAIISLRRLRTSFYGLPEDTNLLASRAQREAVHEIGHLLGLTHCQNHNCVMSFSAAAEEIDLKTDRFCALCNSRENDLKIEI